MAFFGGYLLARTLCRTSIHTHSRTSTKYQFRLLLGVILDITTEMWSKWFEILTEDATQKKMHHILDSFYSILKKWSKLVQKFDFLAHF